MGLNIRKCFVAIMHRDGGTWMNTPYLDKYGEVDPAVRGGSHLLLLNQKRYDHLLRTPWLSGGLPSVVARRMESDNNQGGWESL
jgi:E3 ubiquitin-protein ligase UBR1